MLVDDSHHRDICRAGCSGRQERTNGHITDSQQRAQPTRESDTEASDVRCPQQRHSAEL